MQQLNERKLTLVIRWIVYNGLKVTQKQIDKHSFLTVESLERMLQQRGISTETFAKN